MNLQFIGTSSDGRTNLWSVKCECNRSWQPRSTMFAIDRIQCPNCGAEFVVDYNKQKIQKLKD